MTVTSNAGRVQYTASGSNDTFNFPYLFFDDSDLEVILTDLSGNDTTQTIITNYTISGTVTNGRYNSGADVVFTSNPAANFKVTISRVLPIEQETDLTDADTFPPETVETQLDKIVLIEQQLQDQIDRVLRYPNSVSGISNAILPTPIDDYVLAFDGTTGKIKAIENPAIAAAVSAAAAATSATNAATSATASATSASASAASASAAATSATNAANSATAAAAEVVLANAARDKAEQWAEEDEDVEVEPGLFSAQHWALKANAIVQAVQSALTGNWFLWERKTANFSAVDGGRYKMAAGVRVTLNISPTVTSEIWLTNGTSGNWSTAGCEINSGSDEIEGMSPATGVHSINHATQNDLHLVWNEQKTKWELNFEGKG